MSFTSLLELSGTDTFDRRIMPRNPSQVSTLQWLLSKKHSHKWWSPAANQLLSPLSSCSGCLCAPVYVMSERLPQTSHRPHTLLFQTHFKLFANKSQIQYREAAERTISLNVLCPLYSKMLYCMKNLQQRSGCTKAVLGQGKKRQRCTWTPGKQEYEK